MDVTTIEINCEDNVIDVTRAEVEFDKMSFPAECKKSELIAQLLLPHIREYMELSVDDLDKLKTLVLDR